MNHTEFRQELLSSVLRPELYAESLALIPRNIVGMQGRIASLFVHPIKGARGISVSKASVTTHGLATEDMQICDRMVMPVTLEGGTDAKMGAYDCKRLSQKDTPHLARVRLQYDEENGVLTMDAPAAPSILPLKFTSTDLRTADPRSDVLRAKLTGEIVQGRLLKSPVVECLKELLAHFGEDVSKLGVLMPHEEFSRTSDTRAGPDPDNQSLYSDGAKLHIGNLASLVDFLKPGLRMQYGEGFRDISMLAFRPNMVLSGFPANMENLIRRAVIITKQQSVPVNFESYTPRCSVPPRNVETGDVVDAEPNRWLAKHHPLRPWDKKMTFGINADTPPESNGAVIAVGNTVEIAEERTEWKEKF